VKDKVIEAMKSLERALTKLHTLSDDVSDDDFNDHMIQIIQDIKMSSSCYKKIDKSKKPIVYLYPEL
jgi:hypothetical protein